MLISVVRSTFEPHTFKTHVHIVTGTLVSSSYICFKTNGSFTCSDTLYQLETFSLMCNSEILSYAATLTHFRQDFAPQADEI
jgi:hypothetical protein